MAALGQYQDPAEDVRVALAGMTSSGLKMKQLFLECVLTKFRRSLEHLRLGIEKVQTNLNELFKDDKEAQRMAIDAIFKQYNLDLLSA